MLEMDLLWSKGNHLHNRKVLASETGEVVLARRDKTLDITKYIPCTYCNQWVFLSSLQRHVTTDRCVALKLDQLKGMETPKPDISSLMFQRYTLKSKQKKTTGNALDEILSHMRAGEEKNIIANDDRIRLFMEKSFMKAQMNVRKRCYYASENGRCLAHYKSII